MPIPAIIEHGDGEFEFPDPVITRKRDDLDTLVTEWQTRSATSFAPDGAPPGYPSMTIMTVETTQETSECFRHRLSCEGVFGPKPMKLIRRTTHQAAVGWDTASESWITPSSLPFSIGNNLPGYGNMYAMEVEVEDARAGYSWINVQYQGLISSKPAQRRITVNEAIVSPSDPIIVNLSGGWTTARKGSVSFPRIVVSDMSISTSSPPTSTIPGPDSPPSPPSIQSISISGPDLTWNWPNGWKLAALDSEQIPGKNLWMITKSWEYVWEKSF